VFHRSGDDETDERSSASDSDEPEGDWGCSGQDELEALRGVSS
jgi:hypothetical protein